MHAAPSLICPVFVPNLPAAHRVHELAPDRAHEPAGHGTHDGAVAHSRLLSLLLASIESSAIGPMYPSAQENHCVLPPGVKSNCAARFASGKDPEEG